MQWLGCEMELINVCIAVWLETNYMHREHATMSRADFAKLCLLEMIHEAFHVQADAMIADEETTMLAAMLVGSMHGKPN